MALRYKINSGFIRPWAVIVILFGSGSKKLALSVQLLAAGLLYILLIRAGIEPNQGPEEFLSYVCAKRSIPIRPRLGVCDGAILKPVLTLIHNE